MGFIASFINNINSIFIGQFKIPDHRRIMRCSYAIDIELFKYRKILSDRGFVHCMAIYRMLHMAVNAVQFYGLSVEVKDLVTYFSFLESDLS